MLECPNKCWLCINMKWKRSKRASLPQFGQVLCGALERLLVKNEMNSCVDPSTYAVWGTHKADDSASKKIRVSKVAYLMSSCGRFSTVGGTDHFSRDQHMGTHAKNAKRKICNCRFLPHPPQRRMESICYQKPISNSFLFASFIAKGWASAVLFT